MPRSSAGTYSPPAGQPVVAGTVASDTVFNALVSDLGTELTASLDRSGRGGMQAPLRVPDGAVTAPTLAFSNQTNSGLYRAGASDVRLAVNGVDAIRATATGAEVTGTLTVTGGVAGDLDVAGDIMSDGALVVPTGVVLPFAGSSAPAGFLLCNGAAVSRTTYAALFAVIGTTYGVGDGSTTFAVPDTRSRAVVGAGQGSGLTNRTLAATGGGETHQLVTAELAAHTHTNSVGNQSASHNHVDSGHTHTLFETNTSQQVAAGTAFFAQQAPAGYDMSTSSGVANIGNQSASHNHAVTINNAGSGTAHNNMQPFLALNHIIRH